MPPRNPLPRIDRIPTHSFAAMDPTAFLTALATIVVIDLVLAGDNAIVIALAARNLPAHLQKRAILWGTAGAIVVRSAMTAAVVWLLQIPGLLAAGGLLLLWIAYKLLLPEDDGGEAHGPAATTFWGAMRTIVIADAVMGLDNVLAVAGAAHGSYLLVVLGLLISVPIVVWGSTLVLKLVERHPGIVYIGAGVLCFTAAKMVIGEPLLKPWLESYPVIAALAYLAIPAVLWAGFVRNHRTLASRIHARLTEFEARRPRAASSASPSESPTPAGDLTMLNVLVPVDGRGNSLAAVNHAIGEYKRHHELAIHLLNVQPRLSAHVARWVDRRQRDAHHAEQAGAALKAARDLLAQAGVPHQTHWRVGARAEEICRAAADLGVHHIVMGTARKNSLTRMLEDSTTDAVLARTPVPVEVVTGAQVSRLERWGVPAGVLSLGGLMWLAAD
jgi:YjbE family integral membrane protein